jgi:hypothetical protein
MGTDVGYGSRRALMSMGTDVGYGSRRLLTLDTEVVGH